MKTSSAGWLDCFAGAGGELVVHWCDSVDWPSDGPFYTVHRCSSVESDRFVAVDWLRQLLMVLQLMKVLLLLLLLNVVMSELVLLPSSASLSLFPLCVWCNSPVDGDDDEACTCKNTEGEERQSDISRNDEMDFKPSFLPPSLSLPSSLPL